MGKVGGGGHILKSLQSFVHVPYTWRLFLSLHGMQVVSIED